MLRGLRQRIGQTVAATLLLLGCAPATQSLVVNAGRPTIVEGRFAVPVEQVAVVLWAGSLGNDPEVASVDGVVISSASTNNRLELAPGKHRFVFRGAWKPGDVERTTFFSTEHERIEVAHEVILEAGHCYFPRQKKEFLHPGGRATTVLLGPAGVQEYSTNLGVSVATGPAQLTDYEAHPGEGPKREHCRR
jgi:hypothetical protein